MIDPLLYGSLHLHFFHPVDVVGCGVVVRGACHEFVDFGLGVFLAGVDSVHFHPCEELWVIYDVFLERVACVVNEIDMYVGIVGVDLAPTFIYRHEYRFDARCGLCHKAGGACRCDGEAGDVTSSIAHHVFV